MKIFGRTFFEKENNDTTALVEKTGSQSYQDTVVYGHTYPILNKKWDGEKTLGELGAVVRSIPDFQRLRVRMYDAYTKIDTVKIIASKFFYWTIGTGLKLQAEPQRDVLASEGIVNTPDVYSKFQKIVESRFSVYANSKHSDYLQEKTLHELALDFYKSSFLGGDCLAIVRFTSNGPNVQFISGEFIENPGLDTNYYENAKKIGNKIEYGIELNSDGKHIAYYVRVSSNDGFDKYERIDAYGAKSKKRLAWLVSGQKISPDHLRAVPAMSQSLEKINKLDRYVEAAVNKAENAAKIVYSIEHEEFSTGESPTDKIIAQKRGEVVTPSSDETNDKVLADGLANRITQTTGGTAYNMTQGAKLKSFESSIETSVPEFHNTIFNQISAGSDVPPEVAMQSFNSNYSASRAAINSFGYYTSVNRQDFANKFYIPFYKLWLEHQILTKKIIAPGYIENIDNFMVTESYTQCRFTGKNMPHIDPLKEIKAIREMLGVNGADPLISREQATELLNAGQWDENFMKYMEEQGLIPKPEPQIVDNTKK